MPGPRGTQLAAGKPAVWDGAPAVRRRAPLISLVVAEAVSMLGNRMVLVAVPWLVLVTTGSPTKMGVAGGAAALAMVASSVLGAPLVDRFGMRVVSVATDLVGAAALGLIGSGHYGGFVALVALMSVNTAMSGIGLRAKRVLLAPVAAAAGTPMARVTAIYEGMGRTATLVGTSVGAVIIAWWGPLWAIGFNAWALVVCATIVAAFVHVTAREQPGPADGGPPQAETPATPETYGQALRAGFQYLHGDRLLSGMTMVLAVINTVNQAATSVLLPLWASQVAGSPVALGLISASFAAGAIAGTVVFAVLAPRLPRYPTVTLGYLVGGAPRFVALLLSHDLAVVLAVMFVSGVAICTVNPTYGTLLYERVPTALQARVFGLSAAVTTVGMPLGGLFGGFVVAAVGLPGGLALAALLYLGAATVPIWSRRTWREMDAGAAAVGWRRAPPRASLVDAWSGFVAALARAGHRAKRRPAPADRPVGSGLAGLAWLLDVAVVTKIHATLHEWGVPPPPNPARAEELQ